MTAPACHRTELTEAVRALLTSTGSLGHIRCRTDFVRRAPALAQVHQRCSVAHIGDLDTSIEAWPATGAKVPKVACAVYQAHGAIKMTRRIAITTLLHSAFPDLQPVLKLHLG